MVVEIRLKYWNRHNNGKMSKRFLRNFSFWFKDMFTFNKEILSHKFTTEMLPASLDNFCGAFVQLRPEISDSFPTFISASSHTTVRLPIFSAERSVKFGSVNFNERILTIRRALTECAAEIATRGIEDPLQRAVKEQEILSLTE